MYIQIFGELNKKLFQVITTILLNCCPANRPRIHLTGKAKTPLACWKARDAHGNELPAPIMPMSESEVIVRFVFCGGLKRKGIVMIVKLFLMLCI
jgi:hypothetical protein